MPKDPSPQWRKIAWSHDCTLLAYADSTGTIRVFDLMGSELFVIPPVRHLYFLLSLYILLFEWVHMTRSYFHKSTFFCLNMVQAQIIRKNVNILKSDLSPFCCGSDTYLIRDYVRLMWFVIPIQRGSGSVFILLGMQSFKITSEPLLFITVDWINIWYGTTWEWWECS